ncbi:26632_t:CDS:1, partial [Dentiscutata erythropus]
SAIKAFLSFLSISCILEFVFYTILFFTWVIPYVDVHKIEQEKNHVFYFPTYNESAKKFEYKENSEIQSKTSHMTIIDQISEFGALAGLFFNVAVYSVTSKLNFKNTCIVDDFLILNVF